jgi:redox-sensing transcriptional repressor
MNKKKISELTISRLFIYLREVTELYRLKIKTVSSAELGERSSFSDAQVRKDLGHFGQFGVSGAGYKVEELKPVLERILGKDKTFNVAIVGVGQLGSALLSYTGFRKHGLEITTAFDVDIRKIGKELEGIKIKSLEEVKKEIKKKDITLGIITVPSTEAQGAADILASSGIKGILNFAPVSLDLPDHVKVKNVDFLRELEMLSYFVAGNDNGR